MKFLYVFLMSMVPLIEQRGAIPAGIVVWNLNPILVFMVSFFGSLLPVPFIYIFFNKIIEWMRTISYFDKITTFIDKKVQKSSVKLEKYEELGLILFVGIPLPTTGLWTGTAAASFMGLNFKKSMICVAIGGLISATVITALSILTPALFGY